MIVRRTEYAPGIGDVAADTWPSTGEINTETSSLDASIKQLAQDWFDSQSPGWTPALQNGWNAFVADWNQWRDAGWFWNPGRRDELLGYRKRFNTFVSAFQTAGVDTMVNPGQVGATAPQPDALDKAGDLLTKGLYIVIGVGVLVAGATVYKELRNR